MSELDLANKRFPVDGVLNIRNYDKFMVDSRVVFLQKWNRTIHHEETLSDFELVTLLGTGSFGSVILAKFKASESLYAMKAVEKEKIVKDKVLPHVRSEKKVLECINCPMTVHMDFFFKDNCYIYLVMPYITGGELFSYIRRVGKVDEVQAKFVAGQVVIALEYLHSLDLVHRDLKPENIMMDHSGYVKLIDFGFCKRLTRSQRTYTLCGTPEYLAPEVILNTGYGKPVDWWGVGILLYELAAGSSPFVAPNNMKIYEKVISNRYKMPDYFSKQLKHLISNILQVDLSKRFGNLRNGVKDIKEHPWFSSIDWLELLNRKVEAPLILDHEQDAPPSADKCTEIKLKTYDEDRFSEEFKDF